MDLGPAAPVSVTALESRLFPTAADGGVSTHALVEALLDSGSGISDLVFSPGRPPQVEQAGEKP